MAKDRFMTDYFQLLPSEIKIEIMKKIPGWKAPIKIGDIVTVTSNVSHENVLDLNKINRHAAGYMRCIHTNNIVNLTEKNIIWHPECERCRERAYRRHYTYKGLFIKNTDYKNYVDLIYSMDYKTLKFKVVEYFYNDKNKNKFMYKIIPYDERLFLHNYKPQVWNDVTNQQFPAVNFININNKQWKDSQLKKIDIEDYTNLMLEMKNVIYLNKEILSDINISENSEQWREQKKSWHQWWEKINKKYGYPLETRGFPRTPEYWNDFQGQLTGFCSLEGVF